RSCILQPFFKSWKPVDLVVQELLGLLDATIQPVCIGSERLSTSTINDAEVNSLDSVSLILRNTIGRYTEDLTSHHSMDVFTCFKSVQQGWIFRIPSSAT